MTPKKPTRPASSSSKPAAKKPAGKPKSEPTGFMNWLGRQVGHVKTAVKNDVTKGKGVTKPAPAAKKQAPKPSGSAKPGSSKPSAGSQSTSLGKVIYREDKVEEAHHPDRPGVVLRRTIIDEVVVEQETK